eukprot:1184670-Prorocentrum_minimum.AAC.2
MQSTASALRGAHNICQPAQARYYCVLAVPAWQVHHARHRLPTKHVRPWDLAPLRAVHRKICH